VFRAPGRKAPQHIIPGVPDSAGPARSRPSAGSSDWLGSKTIGSPVSDPWNHPQGLETLRRETSVWTFRRWNRLSALTSR